MTALATAVDVSVVGADEEIGEDEGDPEEVVDSGF